MDQSCHDIEQTNSYEDTFVFEVKVDNPDEKRARPDDFKLLQFFFMKLVKKGKGFYGEHYAKTLPRFNLVDLDLTILELKRLIFIQI